MKDRLCGLLEKVLPLIEREAEEDLLYGAPLVDDPRDYTPDMECCTPEEVATWDEACKKAEAGESVEVPRHK